MDAEARKYKKALEGLTVSIMRHLALVDKVMREPESKERGQKVAKICNALDVANDSVRYSVLGVDFRKDNKDKAYEMALKGKAVPVPRPKAAISKAETPKTAPKAKATPKPKATGKKELV